MQENEFEKQVHEKMEGLKFQPTDAVWLGVESKLRKRKKRRYLFIWLPVYVAVLLLAGYFTWFHYVPGQADQELSPLTENNSRSDKEHSLKGQRDNSQRAETKVPDYNSVEAAVMPNADKDAGHDNLNKQPGTKAVVRGRSISGRSKNRVHKKHIQTGRDFSIAGNRRATNQPSGILQQVQLHATVPGNHSAGTGTMKKTSPPVSQTLPVGETLTPLLREILFSEINPELLHHDPVNTALAIESFPKVDQISLTSVKRRSRLQVGITFQAGWSGISNGELNSLFRAADASAMLSLSAPNAAPNANVYIPPSALKQGPAFSPGIYLKKQLSYRLALTIGLNYALYTSSYQVGQKADSTIIPQAYVADQRQFAGIFRPGSNVKYTNRYHFVELPVLLHTKLTGRGETGLSWDVGFSISRLLSTNALFYDPGAGLYYKDNDVFKKTQWNFVTGLPVNFYSSKNVSFLAGPQFQYGFTKLTPGRNQATHLVFIGLKAGILLK